MPTGYLFVLFLSLSLLHVCCVYIIKGPNVLIAMFATILHVPQLQSFCIGGYYHKSLS
jgi:hypothetical protein